MIRSTVFLLPREWDASPSEDTHLQVTKSIFTHFWIRYNPHHRIPSMKQLVVLLLPPPWMAGKFVHQRISSIKWLDVFLFLSPSGYDTGQSQNTQHRATRSTSTAPGRDDIPLLCEPCMSHRCPVSSQIRSCDCLLTNSLSFFRHSLIYNIQSNLH